MIALFASICVALAITLGNSLYREGSLARVIGSVPNLLHSLLYAIGVVYLFTLLIEWFLSSFRPDWPFLSKVGGPVWFTASRCSLLTVWCVIFICWIPCWLAYYPGIFSHDVGWQLRNLGDFSALDDYHTILQTLFLWFCHMVTKSTPNAVVLYSLIQMALMSFVFSYALYCLSKLKIPVVVRFLAFIWFALSPFNAIFALMETKDTLFAAALLLCTTALLEMAPNPGAFFASGNRAVRLFCFLLLLGLLRKNAIYVLFVAAILMPVLLRCYRKQAFICFGGAFVAVWFLTGPITAILGWSANEPREALSVPAQQIAFWRS